MGSLFNCFDSILKSERIIYSLVSSRDFIQGNARQKEERISLRDTVLSDSFLDKLKKSIAILVPIQRLITKYQADSIPISEVLVDFGDLTKEYSTLRDQKKITNIENDYLRSLCKQRYEFLYGDSHGLAYLLDPRFIGERLSPEKRKDLENILFSFNDEIGKTRQEDYKIKIFQQYTQFVISAQAEKQSKSFRYVMLERSLKSPLQYWQTDGLAWPELQAICLRLFSLATSSASCESNFSNHGFIHSKLRNSLTQGNVEKLVYIRSNYLQFNDSAVYKSNHCGSDEGDSDCSV
ncbi:MAG: hypothetical protein RL536_238 [Candidatus Parcubacteria bacterium]